MLTRRPCLARLPACLQVEGCPRQLLPLRSYYQRQHICGEPACQAASQAASQPASQPAKHLRQLPQCKWGGGQPHASLPRDLAYMCA